MPFRCVNRACLGSSQLAHCLHPHHVTTPPLKTQAHHCTFSRLLLHQSGCSSPRTSLHLSHRTTVFEPADAARQSHGIDCSNSSDVAPDNSARPTNALSLCSNVCMTTRPCVDNIAKVFLQKSPHGVHPAASPRHCQSGPEGFILTRAAPCSRFHSEMRNTITPTRRCGCSSSRRSWWPSRTCKVRLSMSGCTSKSSIRSTTQSWYELPCLLRNEAAQLVLL